MTLATMNHCIDIVLALMWYRIIKHGGGGKLGVFVCVVNFGFFLGDAARELVLLDQFGNAVLDVAKAAFWGWALYQCWRQMRPPKKRKRRVAAVLKRIGGRLVPVPAPAPSLS